MHSISAIIPARDLRPYIGDALASIRAQSRPVHEIIVVDDGSTDGTGDVLRLIQQDEPRLRILSGHGRGPSAARNIGLRAAQGDIIAFLDGDDIWPHDRIERQVARIEVAQRLAVVSGLVQRFHLVDGAGNAPADAQGPALPCSAVSACLFRRDVFDRVGTFNESLNYSEDHDLMLRIREAGLPIAILRHITLYYRYRVGSATLSPSAPADFQLIGILHRSLARRRRAGATLHLAPLSAFIDA